MNQSLDLNRRKENKTLGSLFVKNTGFLTEDCTMRELKFGAKSITQSKGH
jgi:hypothetical protein